MIGPETWGPHGWKFIHYVTLGYPKDPTVEDKRKYKNFFYSIKDILPCSLCSTHYTENLIKNDLTDDVMNNRDNLIRWGIDMHNIVNERLNKPIIEYSDAIKMIYSNKECIQPIKIIEKFNEFNESKESKLNCNNIYNIYGLIGLLFTLVLIAVIYKKN